MKKQQGFTLIELIVVIVILGILAATALPRFANLQGDARFASIRGAEGAIRSAADLAHALSLARGLAAGSSVTMEGVNITMSNFYPTADANGILAAARISRNDYTISGTGPVVVQATGAATPASCQVSYAAASAPGAAPVIALTASADNCQ